MVADLQHIDDEECPPAHEDCLDGCFGIPGKQRGEPAIANQHDHRSVVDVALGERRSRIGLRRVHDLDRGGRIEHETLTGSRECAADLPIGHFGYESSVRRVLERNAGMEYGADMESVQHLDQSRDVVLVRMAQNEQVDAAREEREVGPQPSERQLRIRATVDQHRRARGGLQEDRVALADVEGRQVETPVRTRYDRYDEKDRDQSQAHRQWANEASGKRGARAGSPLIGRAVRCGRWSERPGGKAQDGEPCDRDGWRDRDIDSGVGE